MAAFKFDELVSSYDQVFTIGRHLAQNFLSRHNSNKVVLNVADQFATNNNCGFNLANFKRRFIEHYFEDVVVDYERSFIGSFATAVFDAIALTGKFELQFSISKFEGNMGYSLTETGLESDLPMLYDDVGGTGENKARSRSPERDERRETIPEFVPVNSIQQVYQIFCDANKKNKMLLRNQLGADFFKSPDRKQQLTL